MIVTRWGVLRWAESSSNRGFAMQLATQIGIVLVAVWLTRGPLPRPARVVRVATGMLLAMVVSEAAYWAWFPDPTDSFTLLVICYRLSARLMLSGGVGPQLVVSATCVVAQIVALTVAGLPLPVVVAHTAALAFMCVLLLVGVASGHRQHLEGFYRSQMNSAAYAMASRPAAPTQDVPSAIREIAELVGRTLDVTRVDVWLPDERRTVMRWIDGYDGAGRPGPIPRDVPLSDHPEYLRGLERELLVQRYTLPAPGAATPVCPHVDRARIASVLEAR